MPHPLVQITRDMGQSPMMRMTAIWKEVCKEYIPPAPAPRLQKRSRQSGFPQGSRPPHDALRRCSHRQVSWLAGHRTCSRLPNAFLHQWHNGQSAHRSQLRGQPRIWTVAVRTAFPFRRCFQRTDGRAACNATLLHRARTKTRATRQRLTLRQPHAPAKNNEKPLRNPGETRDSS